MASRRIEDLHPDFQPMVRSLLKLGNNAIADTGYEFFITDGYRSEEEQTRLYAQGRSLPGKVVTNARAGQSAHNYGLAVDMAFQKDGQLFYLHDLYDKIYPIARNLGFILGADWITFKDRPHFEYPNWQAKAKETTMPEHQAPDYVLYPSKRNLKVTADKGVNVRTGPYTNYQPIGAFAHNQEFAVIGFTKGEEVAGNNVWWVTQDDYFVWSGGTNFIPTIPKDQPVPTEPQSETVDISQTTKTQLLEKIEELEADNIVYKKERNKYRDEVKRLNTVIDDLNVELTSIKEAADNILATRTANEVLTTQISALNEHVTQLKQKLGSAYAQAFTGWELIEVQTGPGRYLHLVEIFMRLLAELTRDMTKRHVIGYKLNAQVYSAEDPKEVEAALKQQQEAVSNS